MPCKTYKIGVFFDGTGNNSKFDSSEGRDQQSNIAKLHTLYKKGEFECEKNSCMLTVTKVYIDGIGTYDTQEEHDSHSVKRKYDKGGGGGGAKRIDDAINQVTKLLDKNLYHTSDESYFSTRLIDVFGFSRGAALARDFVNTFYKKKVILEKDDYGDVRFNFIGLYDTVGSFGKAGNAVDKKPVHSDVFGEADVGLDGDLEDFMIEEHDGTKMLTHKELFVSEAEAQKRAIVLKSYKVDVVVVPYYPPTGYGGSFTPSGYQVIAKQKENEAYTDYNFNLCLQSAKKIVHFTAHDEVRKNFPLTNIVGSGGLECRMIGVHSDIGGGYSPEKEELHEFPYKGYSNSVKELYKIAEKKAEELTTLGGIWTVKNVHFNRGVNGGIMVLSRKVLNNLANVTLHLMYEEAIASGALFNELPKDENHKVHDNLQEYYTYAQENLLKAHEYNYSRYMSSEKGGQYARTDDYLETPDGKQISASQIHHSSADPARKKTNYVGNTSPYDIFVNDSADGGGNDNRCENINGKQVDGRKNPNDVYSVQRAIYYNQPGEAVDPKKRTTS